MRQIVIGRIEHGRQELAARRVETRSGAAGQCADVGIEQRREAPHLARDVLVETEAIRRAGVALRRS